mgnify:CR=1 FL=1
MNTSGEVADLMIKEGIQITESAAKLTALGAKNLAAIIIALMKEDNKLQGKTNLKQLLKADKPLCILQIKEKNISKFNQEAKKYGVLFTAVTDKTNNSGLCDVIAKQDDVTKINYIMEKLGYASSEVMQEKTEETEEKENGKPVKKSQPRTREPQSEKRYTARGDNERESERKPSVKTNIKAQQKAKAQQTKEKARTSKSTSRSR